MKVQTKIRVGIVGGAGYTGGELIRLLLQHRYAHLLFVHSKSNAGKSIATVHTDLVGDTTLAFTDKMEEPVDVLFLCLGHGDSLRFLSEHAIDAQTRIIDLSQDFRLKKDSVIDDRVFVYGLPELNKEAIRTAANIANPGCFATALQLALLPLAQQQLLGDAYATGITGSTGAGQGLTETSHFSWRANNISAYKVLQHQHINEIGQSLAQVCPDYQSSLHFVPWRGDFSRGIFTSTTLACSLSGHAVNSIYQSFYRDALFTHVCDSMIHLKQVINTNKCLIYTEKVGDKLVVHTAIDNLLKGASGQALQNMNLMFGIDEQEGLQLKATAF